MPKISESAARPGELKFLEPPVQRGALKLKAAANYLSISVPSIHRLVEKGSLETELMSPSPTFSN
jgi:hypothetical protein